MDAVYAAKAGDDRTNRGSLQKQQDGKSTGDMMARSVVRANDLPIGVAGLDGSEFDPDQHTRKPSVIFLEPKRSSDWRVLELWNVLMAWVLDWWSVLVLLAVSSIARVRAAKVVGMPFKDELHDNTRRITGKSIPWTRHDRIFSIV
jgi:hypothetical protein